MSDFSVAYRFCIHMQTEIIWHLIINTTTKVLFLKCKKNSNFNHKTLTEFGKNVSAMV